MLNVGIIGLGRWGQALVKSVQAHNNAIRFVCGCSGRREKAEPFCRENGILLLDSYDAVLANSEITAVVLATPHTQHADQIMKAVGAGKHVFVEKPMTLDAVSARAAINAAREAKLTLAVGFNRRFHPAVLELKKRVLNGNLGSIATCVGEATTMSSPLLAADAWRRNPGETPAGAMTQLGVHLVDCMIAMLGRVREVYAVVQRVAADFGPDTTNVLLSFEHGGQGVIICSASTASNFRLAVYGSAGLAEVSTPNLDLFQFFPAPVIGSLAGSTQAPPECLNFAGADSLRAELEAFANAVKSGHSETVPLAEVLHGVEVLEAIIKSTRDGRPVPI